MPRNLETISLTFSLLQPELSKKRVKVVTRTIMKTTNSPIMLRKNESFKLYFLKREELLASVETAKDILSRLKRLNLELKTL